MWRRGQICQDCLLGCGVALMERSKQLHILNGKVDTLGAGVDMNF